MPDIGLLELIVIGIVGLLVLGPERLPGFFRQIAGFVRQMKQWIADLKQQFDLEKKLIPNPLTEIKQSFDESISATADETGKEH